MKFNINMIASEFVFIELANAISLSLNELGHESKVSEELTDNNIIIKSFRPFNTNNGKKNILFQTEQLWNRRERGVYDLSCGYNKVWEMYEENVKISKGTKNVVYCPIGYSKFFETNLKKSKEDIDIFFYGSLTDRRKNILNELNKMPYNILGETNIYGIERDKKILRSKMVINIKAHDLWFLGPLHCLLAICKKKFMLCEKVDGGYGPYIAGKHFIEFDNIEDGKEKIDYWLKHDKEREDFAINAYEDIKKNFIFTEYIKNCL
jgi:hypothetical protein